jgi:hypothetical protein
MLFKNDASNTFCISNICKKLGVIYVLSLSSRSLFWSTTALLSYRDSKISGYFYLSASIMIFIGSKFCSFKSYFSLSIIRLIMILSLNLESWSRVLSFLGFKFIDLFRVKNLFSVSSISTIPSFLLNFNYLFQKTQLYLANSKFISFLNLRHLALKILDYFVLPLNLISSSVILLNWLQILTSSVK